MNPLILALIAVLMLPLAASAQSFATKPLTLIVTFPAGGFADTLGRAMARELSGTLGQPVIVNNLAGANGGVGIATLARAPADGHTLAYSTMSPLALQPVLQKDAPLRPGSVQPLCGVVENAMAVVVKATAPQRSVADLLTTARQSGGLSYGTSGANSVPGLGMEELARQKEVRFVHVPYKGDAPALQDVVAGHLPAAAVLVASAAPLVASGDVRMLAVMSDKRHPSYADVPTLAEGGYAGTQKGFAGLYVPNGLPPAVLLALDKACGLAVSSDAVRTLARTAHASMSYLPSADWDRLIRSEHVRFVALSKAGVIQPID